MTNRYYVIQAADGFFEIRQTRFLGHKNHPHDVCGIASTLQGLKSMAHMFTGGIDWSRVEEKK